MVVTQKFISLQDWLFHFREKLEEEKEFQIVGDIAEMQAKMKEDTEKAATAEAEGAAPGSLFFMNFLLPRGTNFSVK